jgi:hypothetical protein
MAGLFPGLPVEFDDIGPTPAGSAVASFKSPPAQYAQDPHWLGGIQWAPHVCSDGHVLDPCRTDQDDTLADAGTLLGEIPYVISHGIRASTRGNLEIDYEDRARNTLIRNQSKLIEKEFWEGAFAQTPDFNGNFFLTQAPSAYLGTLLGDASDKAYKVQKGFGQLEKAMMSALGGAQGMIHVSPEVITYLGNLYAIYPRGNVIYTALGNIVVAGAGYTGSAPSAPGGAAGPEVENFQDDLTGATCWAYATSIPTLWMSDIIVSPFERPQAIDKTKNIVEYRASRHVSVTLDHCVNIAARFDLTNS